jgi:uncharacterized protein YegL
MKRNRFLTLLAIGLILVLIGCENSNNTNTGEISSMVYVGVVAFDKDISVLPLTNNLGEAKEFINAKRNDVDSTALCYAVSKATTLFNVEDLSTTLDKKFIVSFTDGIDNASSVLYQGGVAQAQVYEKAKTDLETVDGIKSYAIGFGSSLQETNMRKLVINGGEYRTAMHTDNLEEVFRTIANSVLASSKNVVLTTQNGTYTEEAPKYFRITLEVARTPGSYSGSSSMICKLVGNQFTMVSQSENITFENPAIGTIDDGKINIPLNNLKFTDSYGTEYYIGEIKVEVSFQENSGYYEDVEDSSASSNINKRIGVVLVLDCSTSLGNAFSSVQQSANTFINTLLTNTK